MPINRDSQLGVILASLFLVATTVTSASELSAREMRLWTQIYHDLNPERDVHWPNGGPRAWAKAEQERVEPITVAMLRGERENIPWNYALTFVAPLMPTEAVRDAVYARMDSMFSQQLATNAPLDEREHGLLSTMFSVLAAANDPRATGALNKVLARDEYSCHTGRKYLLAIRWVGDASSLQPLREMPLRKTHKEIDRMAAMSERIIQARIQGAEFPPQTEMEELRKTTDEFVKALQTGDLEAFQRSFPAQVRPLMTQRKMDEFLDTARGGVDLAIIEAAMDAGPVFEIDREVEFDQEHFQAKLVQLAKSFDTP